MAAMRPRGGSDPRQPERGNWGWEGSAGADNPLVPGNFRGERTWRRMAVPPSAQRRRRGLPTDSEPIPRLAQLVLRTAAELGATPTPLWPRHYGLSVADSELLQDPTSTGATERPRGSIRRPRPVDQPSPRASCAGWTGCPAGDCRGRVPGPPRQVCAPHIYGRAARWVIFLSGGARPAGASAIGERACRGQAFAPGSLQRLFRSPDSCAGASLLLLPAALSPPSLPGGTARLS